MAKKQTAAFETKILYKILKFVLYAILLTPLWVWSIFLFPFITSKVLYFRILVEIAVVLYVPLALKFPELRPRWNWLTGMVWIYLGILIVTSIFGLNFYKSFWGTVERGEGIITMLHFGAYFSMLAATLKTPTAWRRYLATALVVISITGVMSIGQIFCGPDNFAGLCSFVPPAQGVRVSASIGNAAFYAAFMLFGILLSMMLAFESKSAGMKWLFFGNALFNFFMLVYTQTRGGALALYLALFPILVFHALRAQTAVRRRLAGGLAALMIVIPVVVFFAPQLVPEAAREITVVRRILNISINDVTTQSRFDTWRASLHGWRDQFWTGYGYENYNIAFNKYFPPRIFKDAGSQIWFDRAHNTVLDVAITSGIAGVIAYLAIFFLALRTLIRLLWRSAFAARSAVILGALLLAYFFQNLFVFDTHATYLMFFMVLGYLVYLDETYLREPKSDAGRAYDFQFPAIAIMIVVASAASYVANIRPAQANVAAISSFKAVRQGQVRALDPGFRQAVSFGTYMDEEIRQHMVEYVRQVGSSGQLSAEERRGLYSYAAAELEKNLALSSQDAKNYLYLMNFYNVTASELGKLDRVFELGRKALELSPTRMQIYFEMGQAAFLLGRSDEGLEFFRQGVALNPEPRESHMYYLLGALFAKRLDLVQEELAEFASRGFPVGASEHAGAANLFAEHCLTREAREHAEAAAAIDDKYAAGLEQFFANLNSKCP